MTNQEASKVIKDGIDDMSLDYFDNEQYEALTMAIQALKPSGDLISRQAVLMELGKYLCGVPFDEKGIDEVIKDLPSVNPKEPKWIPVSEEMPKDEVEVLIYTTDKKINKAYRTYKAWVENQMEWVVFETLGYGCIYDDDEVLAWMPLPKPYEQERSDKE